MSTNIILDLNDLCKLMSGGEVKCKVKDKNVVLSTEPDVTQKVHMVFRNIGVMDGGHRVSIDGREYIDRIVFQTHLEEQVIHYIIKENSEDESKGPN